MDIDLSLYEAIDDGTFSDTAVSKKYNFIFLLRQTAAIEL